MSASMTDDFGVGVRDESDPRLTLLVDERQGNDPGGHPAAPQLQLDQTARTEVRRDEGQGDAVAEHRGEVAAGHLADRRPAGQDGGAAAGRAGAPRWPGRPAGG